MPMASVALSFFDSRDENATMLNYKQDQTPVRRIELKNNLCFSASVIFIIKGIRENFIKMAVRIMASTKATDPSIMVPRFLIILEFESLSLSALTAEVCMIYQLNFSRYSSMNFAFMLRNSSIYLKKMYALEGTSTLNFSILPISQRLFIIPHSRCIEKDL